MFDLWQRVEKSLRRIQNMPVLLSADVRESFFKIRFAPASRHLSLFLMDYDTKTQQLTAKVTEHSKLVTIQALALSMGVSQSPAYLSIAFQDLAKSIEDDQLQWFLQYLCYLDDLQIGITVDEKIGFQNKAHPQDWELSRQCRDPDCCPYKADLSLPEEGVLGEMVPADEQRCTCHLLRQRQFGKDIFHCLVLRAATLEAALVRADLPTKDATTSFQQHFQHKFLNAARALYTQVLLEGGTPEFHFLARLPPPPHLKVWEPDEHGLPRK